MSWEGDIPNIIYIKKENNMSRIEGEEKYFTAQEARNIANEILDKQFNEELDAIYELINNARFDGKMSIIMHNKRISVISQQFLRNKGFTVKIDNGTQWDPCDDTIISW